MFCNIVSNWCPGDREMQIENRDIAIHTVLNLFEGETSVTEKMVLKKQLTVLDRNIDIYI